MEKLLQLKTVSEKEAAKEPILQRQAFVHLLKLLNISETPAQHIILLFIPYSCFWAFLQLPYLFVSI